MMEIEVVHGKQEPFHSDQQSEEYEPYENVKESSSFEDNSDWGWKDSETTIDRLSYGYEASLEETPDFSRKSLTSDWSCVENEFLQDGWLSQYFFETCCESCCFPVRRIDLSYRKIQEKIGRKLINTDIPPLLVFLGNNPDVITINLAYNDIDDSGFINFIEHAAIHQNIFGLNMSYNNVTQKGIKHMLLLVKCLNIKSLQLRGNSLNNEGVVLLSEFLKRNHQIVELDLAGVGQTVQSLSQLINVLNPIYQSCNASLKILDISRPNPPTRYYVFNGDVVAHWIARLLEHNRRLLGLRLQKYSFSCHDIESLMSSANWNNTLVSLDLGCNNIGDFGLQAICDWLSKRPALKILSLERNIITDHGARSLSRSLPSSKLLLLDISYNRITDDGMIDLLNSLKKSPQLQCLKIFGNCISNPSAQIVRRMLLSKVLRQENLDVRVWPLDNEWYFARYECVPCQLQYFLQPCCREPQLAAGCPSKAAYRRRYLNYTRIYERISDEALSESKVSESVACDGKHDVTKEECNCCDCMKAKEARSKRLSSQYSTISEPADYIRASSTVFKEIGSNRSVLSLNLIDDYCTRREPELGHIAPIIKSVRPEVKEKILRWINLDEDTLEEDLEAAAKVGKEDESRKGSCLCNFLPVSISTILRYLEDEPANILLMQQECYDAQEEEVNGSQDS